MPVCEAAKSLIGNCFIANEKFLPGLFRLLDIRDLLSY